MTVLEITRLNIAELNELIVTCRGCGGKMIYSLDDDSSLSAAHCCRCQNKLGNAQNDYYLRDLARAMRALKESTKVDIDFEIVK